MVGAFQIESVIVAVFDIYDMYIKVRSFNQFVKFLFWPYALLILSNEAKSTKTDQTSNIKFTSQDKNNFEPEVFGW